MKIAGRKNDGAWFRTNKAIHKLSPTDKESFTSALNEAVGLKAAAVFTDMQSLAAECGIAWPPTSTITDAGSWLNSMAQFGIPRQIWNGHFTFTTYAKVGGKLKANYQTQVHFFAKDLRKFCKEFLFGGRQIKDVFSIGGADAGNPGGIPDSDINT